MKVVLTLVGSAFLVITYLQISNMDSRFFQSSFSGAKGLVFYLVGDDLRASQAYRDHFQEASHIQQGHFGNMALEMLAGNLGDLKRKAELAYRADPNDSNALLSLGAIALDEGHPKDASVFFYRLLDQNPDHSSGLLYSAIAQARIGHFETALLQIHRGLRNNKIAWDYYSFLLILESAGQFNAKPDSEKPWAFLAQLYRYLRIFDSSNGRRAIAYAEQAIAAKNFPAHAYVILSLVYTKQGKLVSALEAALNATEIDRNFPDGYWRAGYLYGRLGDIANQYVMYRKAFEVALAEPFFGRNLGFVMMEKLGDAQETVNVFERAVKVNPRNWYAYEQLGDAYAFLGDHETAVSRYQAALNIILEDRRRGQVDRDDLARVVDIHEELASSQRKLGHIDVAIDTLHQAINISPYDVGPRVSLVYLYKAVQRYEDAAQEIGVALKYRGLGIGAHSGLCSVLYEAYQSQRAAECFQDVLKRDPHDMRARRLLPEVLRTIKREQAHLKNSGQS